MHFTMIASLQCIPSLNVNALFFKHQYLQNATICMYDILLYRYYSVQVETNSFYMQRCNNRAGPMMVHCGYGTPDV